MADESTAASAVDSGTDTQPTPVCHNSLSPFMDACTCLRLSLCRNRHFEGPVKYGLPLGRPLACTASSNQLDASRMQSSPLAHTYTRRATPRSLAHCPNEPLASNAAHAVSTDALLAALKWRTCGVSAWWVSSSSAASTCTGKVAQLSTVDIEKSAAGVACTVCRTHHRVPDAPCRQARSHRCWRFPSQTNTRALVSPHAVHKPSDRARSRHCRWRSLWRSPLRGRSGRPGGVGTSSTAPGCVLRRAGCRPATAQRLMPPLRDR